MLRYIYADQLHQHPKLARSMFLDRAGQFGARLGWEVTVDSTGGERDEYDLMNPLYVIWELPDGAHGGSMRFLPTVGRTMVNDHFKHLLAGEAIVSPMIWECSRFCLNLSAKSNIAAALMLGGYEIMKNFGVRHYIGVFDARMIRAYRMIGSSLEVIGSFSQDKDSISVGLWEFDPEEKMSIAKKANVCIENSRDWFQSSFDRGGVATSWNADEKLCA